MAKPKVTLKENSVIIEIPIGLRVSKSGKSKVIASTEGNIATDVMYDGKPIVVGANVYVAID